MDRLLVEISSESTEEPRVFRVLRFPLGGRKGGEGGVGKRDKKLSCKLFQCSLFQGSGLSFRRAGRNRGQRES